MTQEKEKKAMTQFALRHEQPYRSKTSAFNTSDTDEETVEVAAGEVPEDGELEEEVAAEEEQVEEADATTAAKLDVTVSPCLRLRPH
jgi:hypothetical protein